MGTIVAIEDMPEIVHEPYAFLLDNTGVEATVEKNGNGRMLLTHLGERTKMTIQFRLNGRKWQWVKSCLWIDGERAPLASGWDMYVAIYKDPADGRRNFTPAGARRAKIPASQPVDEQYLPSAVEKTLKNLRDANREPETSIVPTVASSSNQYLITMESSASGRKVVYVFDFIAGHWQLDQAMLVNARGYDVTHNLSEQSQIDEFLDDLMGNAGRAAQVTYNPQGSVHQAATTNSVNVRKSTVRRV